MTPSVALCRLRWALMWGADHRWRHYHKRVGNWCHFVSRVGTGLTFWLPGRRGGGPKWVQSGFKIEPKQDVRASCSRAPPGRLFGVTFVSRVGTGVAFWRPGEVRGLQKGTARRREGAKTNAAGNKSYHPFSLTVVSLASSGRALKT